MKLRIIQSCEISGFNCVA